MEAELQSMESFGNTDESGAFFGDESPENGTERGFGREALRPGGGFCESGCGFLDNASSCLVVHDIGWFRNWDDQTDQDQDETWATIKNSLIYQRFAKGKGAYEHWKSFYKQQRMEKTAFDLLDNKARNDVSAQKSDVLSDMAPQSTFSENENEEINVEGLYRDSVLDRAWLF